jgi:hypothetical protein
MSRDCSGFVYVIGNRQIQRYKIGRSTRLQERFKAIQSHSPILVEIIFSAKVTDSFAVEGLLHKRFKKQRKHGEWFDLSDTDLESLKIPKKYFREEVPYLGKAEPDELQQWLTDIESGKESWND